MDVHRDRQDFEASLAREGYDGPTEVVLPAGTRRDPHRHDFAMRGLVIAGEFILVRAGEPSHYRPGDGFTLALGCEHYEAAGPEGATYLVGKRSA